MRVLVACEFSGRVRQAFEDKGHDAWSCDLLPIESDTDKHIQGDVLDILDGGWDLMIAHPPCTYLTVSGARWWKGRKEEQRLGIYFFIAFVNAPVPRICVENPIGIMSRVYRKPDQIIQPWQFGEGETKATCLWLKGLPTLLPSDIVEGRDPVIHRMSPGPERWKNRSRTYQGIADAMADQWGGDEMRGFAEQLAFG